MLETAELQRGVVRNPLLLGVYQFLWNVAGGRYLPLGRGPEAVPDEVSPLARPSATKISYERPPERGKARLPFFGETGKQLSPEDRTFRGVGCASGAQAGNFSLTQDTSSL